jgi:hypothetical protein
MDLTAAFLQSMRTEFDGMQTRADALAQVFGSDEFTERMKRKQATIAAIDAGFLRREQFVARAGRSRLDERVDGRLDPLMAQG